MSHLPAVNIVSAVKFQNFPQSFLLSLLAFLGGWEGVNDITQLILCS